MLPRNRFRSLQVVAAGAAAVAGLALVGISAAGPASASTPASGRYCAVVVGKATTPGAVSPMLARACSDTSMRAATAKLDAHHLGNSPQTIHPDKGALLMTRYENAQYNQYKSGNSTNIYAGGNIGGGDTCDSAGYKLSPNYYWAFHISSAKGHGNCTKARFTNTEEDYAATFALPVNYIGRSLDDDVGIIQVYHG